MELMVHLCRVQIRDELVSKLFNARELGFSLEQSVVVHGFGFASNDRNHPAAASDVVKCEKRTTAARRVLHC